MTLESTLYIVVEGRTDANIIRAILGKELAGKARFFAAGGRDSLATIGRNILVHEGGPVLLVMDSDTRTQRLIDEQKSLAFLAVSGAASPDFASLRDWVKVYAFVPEIEVIFFETPQSLDDLLGDKPSEVLVHEGLLAPKATLAKILDQGRVTYETLITNMDPNLANLLASGRQAQALRATIESMMTPAVKA